ncbi:RdgB/HAM1 family non-canonical purine NTP pyrophosphatase [Homoserinibacter sp. YIM 151385]|uniref:RdgB/HAM1 family non-canonical purine NTP pyrophosphatase n=1 Tax=Homoserinibacter sp. YIM 151385 TaxID=2985506 RepID=UPI0022F05CB4|nr:RdgB/HAM1 family non-canonical purine NTP pyrophosphatase [Homoserinibacter sp. YIM 151385]WBU38176.1 RdgB/HAM1 family non-canonical purine NTP pyrophosphatase [Homoserinibacter sp. YIM 151385]
MKIVLATHNAHKVEELRGILGERLGEHELLAYDGPEPVEDGATFAENALIKARAAARHTGLPAIADDSGIAVDALGGAPGIHSARYAGTRDDGDNLRLLLANLEGVADRGAAFVCAAALVDGEHEEVVTERWAGRVLETPAGEGGFGYDPVFQPAGESRSAAELGREEKNAVSHRALAFGALVERIRARLG